MQTAFFSRVDREYQRIPYRSVLYIVAKNNYSIVVTTRGQKICIYATLSCLETNLPRTFFVRVHRSYIVCLRRIDRFSRNGITIKGEQIPISAQAYDLLSKGLNVICNDVCIEKPKRCQKLNGQNISGSPVESQ
jgi:DNA-binding LytR/AlgR family response regulator